MERKTVFSLSVDHVKGLVEGKRRPLAAHVVLVKTNPIIGIQKVLDVYINYPKSMIVDYQTAFSGIEPCLVSDGINRSAVINFLLQAIKGHTLVTFAGDADFMALGIHQNIISRYAAEYIELQDYFKRYNGQAYGLGPIAFHFGYLQTRDFKYRDIVKDAEIQIKLYENEYRTASIFSPIGSILNRRQFLRMMRSRSDNECI